MNNNHRFTRMLAWGGTIGLLFLGTARAQRSSPASFSINLNPLSGQLCWSDSYQTNQCFSDDGAGLFSYSATMDVGTMYVSYNYNGGAFSNFHVVDPNNITTQINAGYDNSSDTYYFVPDNGLGGITLARDPNTGFFNFNSQEDGTGTDTGGTGGTGGGDGTTGGDTGGSGVSTDTGLIEGGCVTVRNGICYRDPGTVRVVGSSDGSVCAPEMVLDAASGLFCMVPCQGPSVCAADQGGGLFAGTFTDGTSSITISYHFSGGT